MLKALGLSPTQFRSERRSLLSEFAYLSSSDKVTTRVPMIVEMFPLVFVSSEFEMERKVPW